MAVPNEVTYRALQVVDQNGNAVAGLNLASFTVYAYARGYGASIFTAYAAASALQTVSGNLYDLSFLLPPAAGWFYYRIVPNNPLYRILGPNIWSGEVETFDLAKIGALVTTPVAVQTASAVLGSVVNIECIAYRTRPLGITIKDQNGNPIDLTQFTNFQVSVRSKDQTTTKWTGTNGVPYGFTVTGDNAGNNAITFPDSASGPIFLPWAANLARKVGDFLVPTLAHANGWIFRCTTAGNSAAVTEPTWSSTLASTTNDGTAVWTAVWFAVWQPTTTYAVGAGMRPRTGTAAVQAQLWLCTQAGATAVTGSEPAWPALPAAGATVTDGTVVWTYQSDWYAALVSAGPSGVNSLNLYWEEIANAPATDTLEPIVRSSQLQLSRREVGT